jgi:hypothetical protein
MLSSLHLLRLKPTAIRNTKFEIETTAEEFHIQASIPESRE